MNNLLSFQPGASLMGDVLWQSGLFLGVGLIVSLGLSGRPARAHRVLLLAMVGALVTPLFSQLVYREGWGFLSTSVPDSPSVPADSTTAISSVDSRSGTAQPTATAADPREAAPIEPVPTRTGPDGAEHRFAADRLITSISTRDALVGLWCVLSGLSLARLVVSLVLGHRIVRCARPIASESSARAIEAACARLGLRVRPVLGVSSRVLCPAIWCWGRRPVIVLPDSVEMMVAPVDWVGVFCHELAHWLRRDQWSSLFGELLVCALPWHPLAWLAKHRLGQLSELACDDWVLATGLPATDYAESLLGLVPQWRAPVALTAVSSRRGLFERVRHILDERRSSPVIGRHWAGLSAAVMVLAASALALAQSRPAEQKPKKDEKPWMSHTIRGVVLGPDGKPVSGAGMLWAGYRAFTVPPLLLPRQDERRTSSRETILARSRSESNGRYTLTADFDPREFISLQVVVSREGFGVQSHYLKKYGDVRDPDDTSIGQTEVMFQLVPETIIKGRLLTPIGKPATGARVVLTRFRPRDENRQGMSVGLTPTDEDVPSYWPRPQKTDAEGRFTIRGVPQGSYAGLTFEHPDYAVDHVTVNTTEDDTVTPVLKEFEINPAKPTFTHTLEPARPVQGRVTDKETGKPLAGLVIEMIPMQRNGGSSFRTRTDADGRYRISGHQGDTYNTTVYSPGDSGYLIASDRRRGWPVGAKFLEVNFALERGSILRGRVIDADSKRPVVGAAVIYQPGPRNPFNRDRSLEKNPVLTDANGRFAITGLAGEGDLLVEATSEFIRTKFVRGNNERWALFPHGHATVDAPEKGEAAPLDINVRKGVTFTARVVGPDGKPVSSFAAFCPELSGGTFQPKNSAVDFSHDLFVFPACDPSRTYRVIFASARHQLAAVVDIKSAPKISPPIEIRLQPAARVHGKVVTPSGNPVSDGRVYPMIVLDKKPETLNRNEIFTLTEFFSNLLEASARRNYPEKPGMRGEFANDSLIPGMPFYISANSAGREVFHYVAPLKPGEDRDLGTITLKELP